MTTTVDPRSKIDITKDETVIFEANLENSSICTSKRLKWDEIIRNQTWNLEELVKIKPLKLNKDIANILEKSDGNIETLQFSATFKLPWILSFTHKKKEAESTSPPLLIRQFSAKWWKVIKESQADKSAVDRYHKSLMPRTTSVSPSSSASRSSMTNKEIAQRIKDNSNNEALLEKFINEIRGSPTPSENLFQDSQDPYEDENFLNM
ncbi:hypothetical protein Tco_1177982 [Tanacetum coccineum]